MKSIVKYYLNQFIVSFVIVSIFTSILYLIGLLITHYNISFETVSTYLILSFVSSLIAVHFYFL